MPDRIRRQAAGRICTALPPFFDLAEIAVPKPPDRRKEHVATNRYRD